MTREASVFSGIVEAQSRVLKTSSAPGVVRIDVERPKDFTDLRTGDSVCTSGVCLTVEAFDDRMMTFALGDETLKITGWTADVLEKATLNLERSLRMGDRIHGHMVSGHVDATADIVKIENLEGSRIIDIQVPARLAPYLWPKGSWSVNGVSLTINSIQPDSEEGPIVSVCLIPETLKRTNLGNARAGERVNIEVDMMARGFIHYFETAKPPQKNAKDATSAAPSRRTL